jgi:hypothetical protein
MGVTKSEFLAFLDDVERGCEVSSQLHEEWVAMDCKGACFYGAASMMRTPGNWFDKSHGARMLAERIDAVLFPLGINVHQMITHRSRESVAEELRIAAKDGRIPFDPEPQP